MFFKKLSLLFAKRIPKNKVAQYKAYNQLVNDETFKLLLLQGNTARITNGILLAKQQGELVPILKESFHNFMAGELTSMGFAPGTPVEMDWESGRVWQKEVVAEKPQEIPIRKVDNKK